MQNDKKIVCRENLVKALVIAYGVFLGLLHFVRIFDQNFWGDEAFSIRLSKLNFISMIQATAEDVHPPLYYAILQVFCRIFGYGGEVFHLASLLPFLIAIVLTLKVVWKEFGTEAAVIMLTLMTLTENALTYNVEVRMYSWAALFIYVSFLAMYRILMHNEKKAYVVFSVFTLLAAYTHYFALLSVAFFYLFLIGWALWKRKECFKRVAIVCVMAVVVYMPWFIVLLRTMARTKDEFWMSFIPYIKDCVAYIFAGKWGLVWFAIMCLMLGFALWHQRKNIRNMAWLLSGLFAVLGTIVAGNLISRFFKPIFIVRYMYPVTIVAWLLLAVAVSYCKYKKVYTAVITIALLVIGLPMYKQQVQAESLDNQKLLYTLEQTAGAQEEGSVLLTNLSYIKWTVAEHYYPNTECVMINDWQELSGLEADKQYFLVTNPKLGEDVQTLIESYGYTCNLIVEDGSMGTISAVVYKLEKE